MAESVHGRIGYTKLCLLVVAQRLPSNDCDEQYPGGNPVNEHLLGGRGAVHLGTHPGKERAMKFRNPWIDPRITQVGAENARAYLLRRGWKSLGLAVNPILEMFEGPGA